MGDQLEVNQEKKERKNEIIKTMTNMEYYPVTSEKQVNIATYTKLPLSKIAAIGTGFKPMAAAFQNIVKGGGTQSGLYMVKFKKGRQLAKFEHESSFLGSVLTKKGAVGGGQARLNPLLCDPTMLFMSFVLTSTDLKLDSILKIQEEILEFLVQKERSELKGDLYFLSDILNNYKYNWNNEKYKNSNHIKVLDIKQAAERKTYFYKEQIKSKINKKSFLHREQEVKKKLREIESEFTDYQMALYLYAFASFLEVLLLENFDSEYLDGITNKINDYSFKYREIYTKCYNQIEGYAKSSIQSHLTNTFVSVNKHASKAISMVPLINKSKFDERLVETGDKLERSGSQKVEETMEQFVEKKSAYVRPFVENINIINKLYNEPIEFFFDQENVYVEVE